MSNIGTHYYDFYSSTVMHPCVDSADCLGKAESIPCFSGGVPAGWFYIRASF